MCDPYTSPSQRREQKKSKKKKIKTNLIIYPAFWKSQNNVHIMEGLGGGGGGGGGGRGGMEGKLQSLKMSKTAGKMHICYCVLQCCKQT